MTDSNTAHKRRDLYYRAAVYWIGSTTSAPCPEFHAHDPDENGICSATAWIAALLRTLPEALCDIPTLGDAVSLKTLILDASSHGYDMLRLSRQLTVVSPLPVAHPPDFADNHRCRWAWRRYADKRFLRLCHKCAAITLARVHGLCRRFDCVLRDIRLAIAIPLLTITT